MYNYILYLEIKIKRANTFILFDNIVRSLTKLNLDSILFPINLSRPQQTKHYILYIIEINCIDYMNLKIQEVNKCIT